MKNKDWGRGRGGGDLIERGAYYLSSSEKGGLLERGGLNRGFMVDAQSPGVRAKTKDHFNKLYGFLFHLIPSTNLRD